MDLLDPADPDPGARAALAGWLAVQRAFALRPEALPGDWRPRPGEPPPLAALGLSPLPPTAAAQQARALARAGVRLLPAGSLLYPPRLARLPDAPPVLLVRGGAAWLRARCVAIVGARAATLYARRVAAALADRFARAGLVVVSGLARGVDSAAHAAALAAGGASVAFQACGPDRIYPPGHRPLADAIAGSGAVVTELPLGTPPRRPYFPLRNRLISALAEAVVIVEARERSGSLVTARHAADQGVDVYAVPGPITEPACRGSNRLLRDGAIPLIEPDDLLHALGWPLGGERAGSGGGAPGAPGAADTAARADPAERAVLGALADGALHREELAARLMLAPQRLLAALARLELDGLVVEDRDGRLHPCSPFPRGGL